MADGPCDLTVADAKRDRTRRRRDRRELSKLGGLRHQGGWLATHLERRDWGNAAKGWPGPVDAVLRVVHLAAMPLGLVGFDLAPRKGYLILHIELLLYATLVALVFLRTTRFHVPFPPLLAICGSLAATWAPAGAKNAGQALAARAKTMEAR